jgi:hypothetical protein
MADENGVIDENTLLGNDPGDVGGEIQPSPADAVPDLDMLGEDIAARTRATDKPGNAERKPAAEADEVRLPWDPKRQKADERVIKLEKRLAKAEHVIEEQRAKNAPPSDDETALSNATKALETFPDAPELPNDFDTDEEREAYQKAMTKRDAELKRLVAEVKTATAKVRTAKPAAKPAAEPDDDEQGSMQEDFKNLCLDAEVEFGSDHGDKARPLIVRELGKLGFSEAKPATKDQLAKIVTRIYRSLAEPVKSKDDDVAGQPRSQAARQATPKPSLPPGRIYQPTWKELAADLPARKPGHRKTS